MRVISRLLITLCLLVGLSVSAEPYKVLVLPVSIFNVCENYYCFEDPSEIFASDTINYFNQNGKVTSPDLYEIRNKLSANPQLKNITSMALNKYKNNNSIDFASLKKISTAFNSNSILLISSTADKRDLWEVLEISSVFEAIKEYKLETNAVLLDNVNDVVMWSGKYTRHIGDNDSRYWAKSTSQAVSQYEKIKFYSKDIVSKAIAQNVIQRFLPKSIKQATPNVKPKTTDFRPNPLENIKPPSPEEYGEIESEMIYSL